MRAFRRHWGPVGRRELEIKDADPFDKRIPTAPCAQRASVAQIRRTPTHAGNADEIGVSSWRHPGTRPAKTERIGTKLPTPERNSPHFSPHRSPPVRAPKPGPISGRTARILRSHARHIEQLGRRAVRDVIEIGRRLHDAKRRLGHGKFLCWIAHEFGWSERTAENFKRVYDLSLKSENFADLDLPLSALYLLAAPSTPSKALEQVARRVGYGNDVSVAEVKDIIAKSRRASPLRHSIAIPSSMPGMLAALTYLRGSARWHRSTPCAETSITAPGARTYLLIVASQFEARAKYRGKTHGRPVGTNHCKFLSSHPRVSDNG